MKIIIVSNEGAQYGTNDKMVVDTLRFIKLCRWKSLPSTVPYKLFQNEDGLKKPSECLANRSWKQLQRRKFIRDIGKKKNQYRWKETDAAQMVLKQRLLTLKGKEEFDSLAMNFNLQAIDAELSKKYKWDKQDIKDNCTETMQQRYYRKQSAMCHKLYSQYNPTGPEAKKYVKLKKLTKDITNTFKRLAFINTVWKAPPRVWLSVFFNAGAYFLMESQFKKLNVKYFDFVDNKGI